MASKCQHGNPKDECDLIEIKVINRHHKLPPPKNGGRFYVGRPTALGNPFELGKDGDRETCVELYREWLGDKLYKDNPQMTQFIQLVEWMMIECYMELVCSCAPKACHADVIRESVLEDDWLYK